MKRKDQRGSTPRRFSSIRVAGILQGMDAPDYLCDSGTYSVDGHTQRTAKNICEHRQGLPPHTLTAKTIEDLCMVRPRSLIKGWLSWAP